MKRYVTFGILTFFACTLILYGTALAVPGLISYQGKLTDNTGTSLEGAHNITFRLFDAATGGTELWSETQNSVPVTSGIYDVRLGKIIPLDASTFAGNSVYLQVEIDNGSDWETLTPRQQLTATAFALKAAEAEVAVTVLNNAINTSEIVNGAVTQAKLMDGAVSQTKLADYSVTTTKIVDGSITVEKLADVCQEGDILVKTSAGWACGALPTPTPSCFPGDFLNCYSGDSATLNVAGCSAGSRTCNETGTGFGSCQGEVLPQAETCDGADNDCNGSVDDNVPGSPLWYQDGDGDGHGDPAHSSQSCEKPTGYVAGAEDCADSSWAINPDSGERCDGKDSNCDGQVDNHCVHSICSEADINTVAACAVSCDENDGQCIGGCMYVADINQACKDAGIDLGLCMNNHGCGTILNPDIECIRSSCKTLWENVMGALPPQCNPGETRGCGQSEGECSQGAETCGAEGLWSGDCVGAVGPAPENCDGLDNNCDGLTDNMEEPQWAFDQDGDDYAVNFFQECDSPDPADSHWRAFADFPHKNLPEDVDCDDGDANIHPGAVEVCDAIDHNCNGEPADGFPDADGDGDSDCVDPDDDNDGSSDGEDCQPFNPDIFPGADEVCDGVDNDCSGAVDDNLNDRPSNPNQTGVCWTSMQRCDGVNGYVVDYSYDNPDYEQVETRCDNKDNDCNGTVDHVSDGVLLPKQSGVCAGVTGFCVGGTWLSGDNAYSFQIPNYSIEANYNNNCSDGLDNDCDDLTDQEEENCP